jgi:hypothetical protein
MQDRHGEEEKELLQRKAPGTRASRVVYGASCLTSGGKPYVLGALTLMEDMIIRTMEGRLDAPIRSNRSYIYAYTHHPSLLVLQ